MNMLVSRIGFSRVAAHAGLAAALLLLASCGDSGNNSGRPSLASESISRTFAAGRQIEAVRFANSGGTVSRCLVSPTLPEGLEIKPSSDGTSCELSGMPVRRQGVTTYTVTAYNSNGTALTDARISFRVNAVGMLRVIVSASSGTVYAVAAAKGSPPILSGTAIKNAVKNKDSDGAIDAPSRAIGVIAAGSSDMIDANGQVTIVLTTVPTDITALVDGVEYDIYIVVELSPDPDVFTRVEKQEKTATPDTTTPTTPPTPPPAAAVPILANASAATLTENSTAGLPIRFTNSGGGALTSCTVSNPALPAGLTARRTSGNASCEIIGTPTAMTARATYTMTATNATGSDTATVSITINAAPPPATAAPILANVTAPQNLTLGAPAPTIRFTNTGGGSLTSCTVSNPALPSRPDGQAPPAA